MADIKISFFIGDSTDVSSSGVIKGTLSDVAQHFKKPVVSPKDIGYFVRGECDKRDDEHLSSADIFVIDGDSTLDDPKSCIPPEEMHEFLKEAGINHFIYTTHSHDPVNGKNKFRAVCESHMTCKEQLIATAEKFFGWANHMGCRVAINNETKKWSQPWFKANVEKRRKTVFRFYEWYGGGELTPVTDYKVSEAGIYEYADDPKYVDALEKIKTGESMHTGVISLGNYFAAQGVSITFARMFIQGELRRAARPEADIEERISALNINLQNCYDNIAKRMPADSNGGTITTSGETVKEFLWDETTAQGLVMDERIFLPANLLGELTEALLNTMWKPNLMSASLIARATVSYLGGGNYRSNVGDRCNLQQLAVGPSGCGKDIIIKGCARVVAASFGDNVGLMASLLRGIIKNAGSAEGLDDTLRTLGHKHDILFTKDEISGLLVAAAKGGEQKKGILDYALEMYTMSNDVSPPRALSLSGRKGGEDIVLQAPHFNISGTSTPEELLKGLTADLVGSGNISRLMFFNAGLYEGERRLQGDQPLVLSDTLRKNLRRLVDSTSMVKDSNIHSMPAARMTNPKLVFFSEDVLQVCFDEANEDDKYKGFKRTIRNRRVVNAKKLAMCEAMLANPESPVVTMDNLRRQLYFVTNSCEYSLALFSENIGESQHDVAEKEVINLMRKVATDHPGKWLPRAKLLNGRKCRSLKPMEKKQLIEHLKESGYLLERASESNLSAKEYAYGFGKF